MRLNRKGRSMAKTYGSFDCVSSWEATPVHKALLIDIEQAGYAIRHDLVGITVSGYGKEIILLRDGTAVLVKGKMTNYGRKMYALKHVRRFLGLGD